ncbi:thiJ/PfpI family protein [Burkholderia mallei]|nr:thiJ/PfpI family protein [Burkholderia mallei]
MFPQVQQLDLTGPHDVFASLPGVTVRLVWKTREPVASSSGLVLAPNATFDDCPPLDVICVPGGIGVADLMEDADTLAFLRRHAAHARYVSSVCTGALVLGAAGLLRGRRATTHWAFHSLLAPFGATPVRERVVRDGNLVTGGGVTAGIVRADARGRARRRGRCAGGAVAARICAGPAVRGGRSGYRAGADRRAHARAVEAGARAARAGGRARRGGARAAARRRVMHVAR